MNTTPYLHVDSSMMALLDVWLQSDEQPTIVPARAINDIVVDVLLRKLVSAGLTEL